MDMTITTGHRYEAQVNLSWIESFASNAAIASDRIARPLPLLPHKTPQRARRARTHRGPQWGHGSIQFQFTLVERFDHSAGYRLLGFETQIVAFEARRAAFSLSCSGSGTDTPACKKKPPIS